MIRPMNSIETQTEHIARLRSVRVRPLELVSNISDVHVSAGIDVVEQVPANVVGVGVDNKVVPTVDAPGGEDGPFPWSYFEVIASRELKPVMDPIHPEYVVRMLAATVVKISVIEGAVQMKSRIVGVFMSVPVIVIDML